MKRIFYTLILFALNRYVTAQEPVRRVDSLKKVTVTAQKNGLQVESGKVVMNVGNSALTTGASVFDLLKKMPGVSVSQDDNIALRGSAGVNVLIDGKMNYLSGKQLADFLKGLTADNVAKIEIITAPSAEFDAAGNAGIINIVTRRRTLKGYAIDLRSSVTRSSRWLVNENISASINTQRLSLFGSFDYNTPHRFLKSKSGNQVQENGSTYRLERTNNALYSIRFYTYRMGADWRINDRHQVSAHYHGYFDDFKAPKQATLFRYDAANTLHSVIRTSNLITEPYHYDAGNLTYTWHIDSTNKKLTVEGHYIAYRNLSDALMTSVTNEVTTNALRSHQPGYITIRSAKADLEWPLKGFLLKAGAKYAWVFNDNNYRFDSLTGAGFKEATSMSNHFKYEESIAAAYLSFSKKLKRSTLLAGLRIEQTDAKSYTVKGDFFNRWQYTSFFPSVSIDRELGKHKLSVSISRRINRPTYSDLNPVRWYTDPFFYYSGNPSLVAEMAWLLSGTVTINKKYIVTATYGLRENYLTKLLSIDSSSNAVKSQTANFSNMQRFDVLVAAPFSAGIWSLQLSAGVNYSSYPVTQLHGNIRLSRWAASLQAQQQFKLPAGFRVEIAAFLYSRELWGIYLKDELFYADAGIKRSFFNNKLDLQLTFSDFLRTYRLKGVSLSNTTDYRYYDRPDAHRTGFSIRYHIGGKLINKKAGSIEEQERL